MKKGQFSRFAAIVLAAGMALGSLASCAGVPAAGTSDVPAAPAESAPAAEAAEPAAEAAEPAAETAGWTGDVDEIQIMLFDLRGVSDHAEKVTAAMNAITEPTIGVKANIKWIDMASYVTQVGLSMSSGEQVDIISVTPIPPTDYTTMVGSKQLMDITDYLEADGQELMAICGDYMDAMAVNGRFYGVPCYRNYANVTYAIMRKDILDELGLTEEASKITSYAEYSDILAKVKEGTDIYPLGAFNNRIDVPCLTGDNFSDTVVYDTLGDNLQMIFTDDEGNVSLLPEQEVFRNGREIVRDWYSRDFIHKDSTISDEHVDTLMKTGVIFSSIQGSEIGVETAKQEATGYEMLCVELFRSYVRSANVIQFGMAVPSTAAEPEAAVRWLNALYSDPQLTNLLTWGIEGEDYVVKDGVATFPEGVTADNVEYHSADFLYGNYFADYPWEGTSADFRNEAKAFLDAAPISPYLGFNMDMSELTNVITALTGIKQKYTSDIYCGKFTDEQYETYIADAKTAGADEYIAVHQEQLSAWKEAAGNQ